MAENHSIDQCAYRLVNAVINATAFKFLKVLKGEPKKMEENITLMDYAVVEDGIITNVLVFDNEKTAEEFGCLPLAPYQGIGDAYMSPEQYRQQQFQNEILEAVNGV